MYIHMGVEQEKTHRFRTSHENIDRTLKQAEEVLGKFDVSRQVRLSCLDGMLDSTLNVFYVLYVFYVVYVFYMVDVFYVLYVFYVLNVFYVLCVMCILFDE